MTETLTLFRNGFSTPVPSLILHLAFTVGFMPATWAGILGLVLFWQWTYMTSAYWLSLFVAGQHRTISMADLWIYIWGTNSRGPCSRFWACLCPFD